MHTDMAVSDKADAVTTDERWTAWVNRGVEDDRRGGKRAIAAFTILGGGAAVWLALALLG